MIVPRFFQAPNDSFFLFGPRGTGKSTWLREQYPAAAWVDLLARETYRLYSARPERLRDVIAAAAPGCRIVVDEVQRVPQLLDVVHESLTKDRSRRFVLTGSSARKLRQTGVNLLGGRALNTTMHGFMAAELKADFDLDQALLQGLLPVVVSAPAPEQTLRDYVGLYVEQEVKSEAMVRNVGSFTRFLEAMAFSHACQLNLSAVSRECQVPRATVEGFLEILEDLLLGFRVPVFTRRARRLLVQHPKFYYFDAGVYRSLRPTGPLDAATALSGAVLEGLVAQHLRAWIAYRRANEELHYWRTKSGVEVDFIIYGTNTFCAVEVKNSRNAHRRDVSGLKAFLTDYPEASACLLYRGQERLRMNDILCLPVHEFLKQLTPSAPIPSE